MSRSHEVHRRHSRYYAAKLNTKSTWQSRAVGDRRAEGTAAGNLGITYLYGRDFARAIELFETHRAACRLTCDRQGEEEVLGNLGTEYALTGDMLSALECYDRALTLYLGRGDSENEAITLGNIRLALAHLDEQSPPARLTPASRRMLRGLRHLLRARRGRGRPRCNVPVPMTLSSDGET